MTNRLAVGTPVAVKGFVYAEHMGRNDLVVLNQRDNGGYGIGPKGNDAERPHDGDHGWLFYTANEVTPKTIEKESNTVTKFKVGDKVEVFQNGLTAPAWVGVQGIVKEVLSYGYRVELTDVAKTGERAGYRARLNGDNLKLVEEPKPFTFKDIQVGDTIRRTLTRKSGAKEVREGTVSRFGSYFAEDNGYILAYDTDDANHGTTLELVNRPEPKPTLLENTKKGDTLVIAFNNGVTKVYTKGKKGSWTTLVLTGNGKAHTGYTWSSEALEKDVERTSVKAHTLITK